jgi:hypothetical protein
MRTTTVSVAFWSAVAALGCAQLLGIDQQYEEASAGGSSGDGAGAGVAGTLGSAGSGGGSSGDAGQGGASAGGAAGNGGDAGTAGSAGSSDAGLCGQGIVISELQSRGSAGANDEFIELFNATPTTRDMSGLMLKVRAFSGNVFTRWIAPPATALSGYGYMLITGSGYNGPTAADIATSVSGMIPVDAGSVWLEDSNGAIVDAVGFYWDAAQDPTIRSDARTYPHEGLPVSNLPHNNTTTGGSNRDVSLQRKGTNGSSCQDTGDNSADFASGQDSTPQNRFSPTTPP